MKTRPMPTMRQRRRRGQRRCRCRCRDARQSSTGRRRMLPPSAPIQTPPNFALDNFDHAVTLLKHIMTKPLARFDGTTHGFEDLDKVEAFIRDVKIQARRPS